MRIFSHRGLIMGTPNGVRQVFTEAAFLSGHQQGVRHYDLDLIWSADGHLFVAHPTDLRQRRRRPRESVSVFDISTKELEQTDGSGLSPLRVTRLLELTAQLGSNVTLALDLKGAGRAEYRPVLDWLHAQVVQRRLQHSVWLWVVALEDAERLRGRDVTVRLGKPIYDVGARQGPEGLECGAQIGPRDAQLFSFLGPSVKCANSNLLHDANAAPFFRRRKGSGWLVWVVDDLEALRALHAAGVQQVISNRPLALQHDACQHGVGSE